MVSTYPLPDQKTIEAHYAAKFKSGNYQLLRDFSQEYESVYRGFVKVLAKRLAAAGAKLQYAKVLDIGCFTGDLLALLKAHGAEVYGLELQKEAVEIANRRLPGRIFQADVLSSDFPQMSFDIVTMMGVIEHVLDPMRILERSAGLLQKGGWLMVQTPDSSSLIARAMGRLWPPYAPVEHIHLFGRRSLALALARVGFDHPDFQQHWKRLPITYVYEMLQHFGPEFHHLFGRLYRVLSPALTNLSVPFYVGEIVVTACRK